MFRVLTLPGWRVPARRPTPRAAPRGTLHLQAPGRPCCVFDNRLYWEPQAAPCALQHPPVALLDKNHLPMGITLLFHLQLLTGLISTPTAAITVGAGEAAAVSIS